MLFSGGYSLIIESNRKKVSYDIGRRHKENLFKLRSGKVQFYRYLMKGSFRVKKNCWFKACTYFKKKG